MLVICENAGICKTKTCDHKQPHEFESECVYKCKKTRWSSGTNNPCISFFEFKMKEGIRRYTE